MFKKAMVLVAVAAIGYVAYSRFSSARAERDLWNEATAAPDLT